MTRTGSNRLPFWIGWLAGVAVCALWLAPVDGDELFYGSYGRAAEQALDGLAAESPAGWDVDSPRPLRLRAVALDPGFVRDWIQTDAAARRPGQLAPDAERGIVPERELHLRLRTAWKAWNDRQSDLREELARLRAKHPDRTAAIEEARRKLVAFHPLLWTDDAPPEGVRPVEGVLTITPVVDVAPWPRLVPGASGCRLALAVDPAEAGGAAQVLVAEGRHGWPTRAALLPPILAILLAVACKRTIPALAAGVLAGAFLLQDRAGLEALTSTLVYAGRDIVWERVLTDLFRVEIIGFVVFLCMAVGVMSRSGGIQGLVAFLSRFAVGPRSTQLVTYLSGLLIFFDDYSNCIIVGNTMRPLSDAKRVSREKLSYIVDSTAAPIAAIAVLSTWVAYEISTFSGQLSQASSTLAETDGFRIFLATIPFRFYCLFTIAFVALTILLRREFGPMLQAERRSWHLGQPIAPGASPMVSHEFTRVEMKAGLAPRASNAVLPVFALIGVTIFGIWYTGSGKAAGQTEWFPYLRAVLEGANSTRAILWGSVAAFALAAGLALGRSLLTAGEVARAAWSSARALFFAVIILVLAWCIGVVCERLETASYLTALSRPLIRPELLPTVLFLTSCLVAFATGSSWSTMAILLPNVVVLAWTLGESPGSIGGEALLVLSIGAVLEGSIFGDHCSPISDTTVLSSVATASDHLDHVRTQAPYAMTTMVVTLVVGYLPVAFLGADPYLCMGAGVVVLAALLLMCGRDPADPLPEPSPEA